MLKNKEIYNLEQELNWLEDKNIYKQLDAINVHNGQPAVLAYIYMHKDCTQYEIARYLGLSRASVGVSIKRMQKAGFVDVKPSKKDARSTSLSITKLGIKTVVKSDMVLDEYISNKFKDFSNEELDAYLKLLEKIKKNLSKVYRDSMSTK